MMDMVLAFPTKDMPNKHNRVKRSFISSFFWKGSTEPPVAGTNINESIENSQTIYAVPKPANSNIPPSFVPVLPVQYFVSPNGQHFIAVKPVSISGPNWLTDNLIENPKSQTPSGNQLNLTPTELSELNQLARMVGVNDVNDLPPLEDVMILLGTTSKSETIKAIRDYASTPGGLELIKDYVASYQPVKRMDIGGAGQFSNAINSEDPSQGKSMSSQTYSPEGYLQINTEQFTDQSNSTTPAPSPGFFAGLRSFFSFGSSTGTNKETEKASEPIVPSGTMNIPAIGANYIPHFIIPMQPLVGHEHYYNYVQPDFQGYQMTPAIQDMNPFVLKPYSPQYVSSTASPSKPLDTQRNEAHINFEDTHKQDVQDKSSIVEQRPIRVSPSAESTGKIHKSRLDEADLLIVVPPSIMERSDTASIKSTTTTIVPESTTVVALGESTTPIIKDN
ncbi:uncharacterized protein LOC131437580 [Malaya genurostris]|uniref:uncharacterized protein LOC131437580 n=1 Tax=Malaya genurostris TaxID=325434 RepID=UPI0026F3C2D1|nr:uncharacterized protein LOC131437580 [Malaya genurostris]